MGDSREAGKRGEWVELLLLAVECWLDLRLDAYFDFE
jgi:hypothetical protein